MLTFLLIYFTFNLGFLCSSEGYVTKDTVETNKTRLRIIFAALPITVIQWGFWVLIKIARSSNNEIE